MTDKPVYPSKLPPATREAARYVWDRLSPADRRALQELIEAFPSQSSLVQLLLRLATTEFKIAAGRKHRIAIVGPTNVGKSTFYNQLVQRKEDRAEVSPLPGTTRANQQADAGLFHIVDTPGADAVGEVGQQEQEMALAAAANAEFLILMFDAIQGIKRTELELYERLVGLGKPYIVVMNKIDLARRERQQIIEGAANSLRLHPDQVIPIVAKTGENMDDVLVAIAMTEPEIVAALGQALPHYRWQLAWRAIVSAASASAAVALTPLPVVDFIPLMAVQSAMVLAIARIYNYQVTLERARELAAAFGLGFLGRMLFRQLAKLGGVPGWLLSSAIATATTVVMGYAASIWFETGERVSTDTLKRMTGALTRTLLARLRRLGRRKPSQQSLKQEIEEALREMPGAEKRSGLEQAGEAAPDPEI
jgi:small GTP-binding protein